MAATKKRYLPQHPQTIQATTQLEQLRQALRDTLKNAGEILGTQYQAAVDAENKLNEALKEQEQDALELNKIAIPYNVLQREVDSDRAMYDAVNARFRETKWPSASNQVLSALFRSRWRRSRFPGRC